jgi:hypothetical protein
MLQRSLQLAQEHHFVVLQLSLGFSEGQYVRRQCPRRQCILRSSIVIVTIIAITVVIAIDIVCVAYYRHQQQHQHITPSVYGGGSLRMA